MKAEAQIDLEVIELLKKLEFDKKWYSKKHEEEKINKIFEHASKKKNDEKGYPDLIYYNDNIKLLIIIENKSDIKKHQSKEKNDCENYAVDGVLHYLSFCPTDLKVVGIAFSGDPQGVHNISTFILENGEPSSQPYNEFLNESDYKHLFDNFDKETAIKKINRSASEINNYLRNIDANKRPLLLSACIIALFNDSGKIENNFSEIFHNFTNSQLSQNLLLSMKSVLKATNVPLSKIETIMREMNFIENSNEIESNDLLIKMLYILKDQVLPLLEKVKNYDIIGKFYQEFLKYAGIANVKKGIVLTPEHITELFLDILESENCLNTSDVFLDGACGTGSFLISAMNKVIEISDKQPSTINKIKSSQLVGVEISELMYCLALSNMLFRGDGKSSIFNDNLFDDFVKKEIKKLKPTIGLLNPPYGGKDNKKSNSTKKEIQFVMRMLELCSNYVLVIAPLSTFFTETELRKQILKKHTLQMVINMPKDLFAPSASAYTAIGMFKANSPHKNKKVYFYNLEDDGFSLSKDKGRRDSLGKWDKIKSSLLDDIRNRKVIPYKSEYINISSTDIGEWILQANIDTDFSKLKIKDFEKTIQEFKIYEAKKNTNMLGNEINEIELMNLLGSYFNDKPTNEEKE